MKVVPDSNIFIALVISLAYSQAAIDKMEEWEQQNTELQGRGDRQYLS